jgi:hypothetical protein
MTDDALRLLSQRRLGNGTWARDLGIPDDTRPIIDVYLPGCAPERRGCASQPLPNDPYRIAKWPRLRA